MQRKAKIASILFVAAVLMGGCFVGARDAGETRYPVEGKASTATTRDNAVAVSRSNPTFLLEARILYEGRVSDELKQTANLTPADVAQYEKLLADLNAAPGGYAACAGCHLPTGCGNKAINATNFTNEGWQKNNSSPGMLTSIVNGKGKVMPSYKDKLTYNQISYLVEYVRKFNGKNCGEPVAAATPSPTSDVAQRR